MGGLSALTHIPDIEVFIGWNWMMQAKQYPAMKRI